jgi:hypothetical protein
MDLRIYDAGTRQFWSNEDGWGDLQNSTHFSQSDSEVLALPLGVGRVEWMSVDTLYPLGETGDERLGWDVFFDIEQPTEAYLDTPPVGVDPSTVWTVYEDEDADSGALIARPGISWHHAVVLGFIVSTEPWTDPNQEFIYFNGKLDS